MASAPAAGRSARGCSRAPRSRPGASTCSTCGVDRGWRLEQLVGASSAQAALIPVPRGSAAGNAVGAASRTARLTASSSGRASTPAGRRAPASPADVDARSRPAASRTARPAGRSRPNGDGRQAVRIRGRRR
jgi:hypothetical protein